MTILDGLSEFIRSRGGTTTSVPGVWPLRYDIVPTQSEALMTLLHEAGWRPQPRGTSTQLGYAGFHDALTFEISKPKDAR